MSDKNKAIIGLLDLIIDLVKDGIAAEADGKITVADLPLFTNIIPDLGPAFSAIGDLPAEVKALTVEDSAALAAHIAGRLSLSNAHAQAIVAASLKAAVAVFELVMAVKTPVTA